MAERRLHGLQRVLGVNALFSTAYGNVGSSIYYALGLVASFALGLTPVVFIITGFIFLCTAATYAEATAMYPEAGGSSSFARRAFNEFWSFFAAWAQMLNYMITIAISAFFVPHYLGGAVLGRAAPLARRHHLRDRVMIAVLGADQRRRRQGVGGRQHRPGGRRLPHAAAAGAGRPASSVFSPEVLVDNVHFGVAPTWKDFVLAIPIGMIAYTGIETISNMAEEAKDEEKTIPAAINRVRDRRLRDLLHAAGGRAVRAAGDQARRRQVHDAARPARGAGRLRRRPGARRRQATRPRASCSGRRRSTSACWPRRSCSSPPTRG